MGHFSLNEMSLKSRLSLKRGFKGWGGGGRGIAKSTNPLLFYRIIGKSATFAKLANNNENLVQST